MGVIGEPGELEEIELEPLPDEPARYEPAPELPVVPEVPVPA